MSVDVESIPLWVRITAMVHEKLRSFGIPSSSIFYGPQRVVGPGDIVASLAWCVTIEPDDGPSGAPLWCFVVERIEGDESKYAETFNAFIPSWNGTEHHAFREAVFAATPFENVPFVWSLIRKGIIGSGGAR